MLEYTDNTLKKMRYKIGVMGSAQGPTIKVQENIKKAIAIGQAIAEADCVLVTGACPGLPDEAAFGAKNRGGMTMGVSPAFSEKEHIEMYHSPTDNFDIIIYTGMGLMERDLINIRSSDAIVILGGGIGTLNEFTVAYDDGKVVGVLTGTGGVSNHIDEILKICDREVTEGVIFDSDPKKLIEKIINYIKEHPGPTLEDERVFQRGKGE
ncbi:LOG family protein [Candidatus Peregrinibacteria bacterium]|nr:LOG family protein [Candidatus Peregrinibacteria bacterium]